ncbi:MAG: hypothetical protein BRC24_00055 [Parcubacteria group bacterium SW_4_46_8]|nr:MAG: hypothetical protein BRC24_00055 [Parcubacteria group bacterium SW_4_46_8]
MFEWLKNLGETVKDKGKQVKDKGKKFAIKKMLKRQMKDMPEAQRKQVMEMVDKNPELFEKMGKEIKEKVDNGMSEQMAAMRVAQEYQDELQNMQQ